MRFFAPVLLLAGLATAVAKSDRAPRAQPQSEPRNVFDRRQIGVDACASVVLNFPSNAQLCALPVIGGVVCPLGPTLSPLIALLNTIRLTLQVLVGGPATAPLPLVDLCLCLDGDVLSPTSVLALLAEIDLQLGTDGSALDAISDLVPGLGITLEQLLTALAIPAILDASSTCDYPLNSIAVCNGPCAFVCEEGFLLCGGECLAVDVCPSDAVVPEPLRRRSVRNDLDCPVGKSACGIPDMLGKFECLDTRFDVESCGGCTFPLPGYQRGVDCTALPNVVDVNCVNSQCVIESCATGYSFDGLLCVADESTIEAAIDAVEGTTGSGFTAVFVKGLGRVVSARKAEKYRQQEAKSIYAARQAKVVA